MKKALVPSIVLLYLVSLTVAECRRQAKRINRAVELSGTRATSSLHRVAFRVAGTFQQG